MATESGLPNGGTLKRAHVAEVQERNIAIAQRRRKQASKKAEDEGLLASLCTLVCDHQIGIVVNLLSLLFLTHIFFPRARSRTSKFFRMSYHNPENGLYGCGTDDLPFVVFWAVVFTGMRVLVMEYLLDPLARVAGIRTRKGLDRFKEQAWLIVYYTASWSLGMYITYNSDFWLNVHGIWLGWPFREIGGLLKFYYLVQWAFYLQQILVVNIEEKRKDFLQMFVHHIFTAILICLSYGYYHTRVGIVILCIMDLVDIILPTAKLLKYMGYNTICDIAFGLFVLAWFCTRHVLYMIVCWSIYKHGPVDISPGCYFTASHPSTPSTATPLPSHPQHLFLPISDTTSFEHHGGHDIWSNLLKSYTDRLGPICLDPKIRYYFLGLLLFLQALCCVWFTMILRVVYKVLSGTGADDVRSDDEDDLLDERDPTSTIFNAVTTCSESGMSAMPGLAREEQLGVDKLSFARQRDRRMVARREAKASGISIPGHGDRKELLGRIGCDKPS